MVNNINKGGIYNMSASVDHKVHEGHLNVKYGEPFPKANNRIWLRNKDQGNNILAHIVDVGQPKWTEKLSVRVPFRYYVTESPDTNTNIRFEENDILEKNHHLKLVK